jgi:hypothetical protein
MIDLGFITIRCDHDGCATCLATCTSSPHRAREIARRAGWATRLTRDAFARALEYCPDHAAAHEADTIDGRGF